MPDITAQAPDGSQHIFPDNTDPAVIDRVMKSYITGGATSPTPDRTAAMAPGSYQARPGGPVLNANESPFRAGVLSTERGLGINNPQSVSDAIMQTLKGFGGFVKTAGEEPLRTFPAMNAIPGGSAVGAALGIPNIAARAAEGIASGLEGATKDIAGGWDRGDPRSIAAGVGSLFPLKAATMEGPNIKGAVQEVMGEGASKGRLLADQHAHALATKQHLSGVADAVHTDAQSAMSEVLAKVDSAKPEGAFSKAEIQSKVSDAMGDLVKVPEKMPASVAKILKVEKPTWENLAATKEVGGLINRLRSSGLTDVEVRETLRNQGFSEREVQAATSGGGSMSSDALTAEQLKQMRSDVGQELARYGKKGTVGAALNKVYGTLSTELRNASKDAGVESDWLDANAKYTQYAADFLRGPLKRTLGGGTASSIMEPLTGSTRLKILDTLQKYRDAGFNIDIDTLGEEMKRYGMSRTVNRLSQPTKMDLLMAGFSPKALAIRQAGPRIMRMSKLPLINKSPMDMIAGEGFDAPIPARNVYPTKAAALKASKGETPKGNSTPFSPGGYSPSEKATTMSAQRKSLGPEFEAGQREEMIDRYKAILRNPRATGEDIAEAKQRLKELGATGQ